jgi:amidase
MTSLRSSCPAQARPNPRPQTGNPITLTGLPAASVSAGLTPEGLPVGLQIVGRHQQDFAVLQLAHAFEQVTGFSRPRAPVVG